MRVLLIDDGRVHTEDLAKAARDYTEEMGEGVSIVRVRGLDPPVQWVQDGPECTLEALERPSEWLKRALEHPALEASDFEPPTSVQWVQRADGTARFVTLTECPLDWRPKPY